MWDLLHRLHCSHLNSTSDAGLTIIRLEMLQVLKLRQGPFRAAGNHGVLLGAAGELFRMMDESCPLFDILYEDDVCCRCVRL